MTLVEVMVALAIAALALGAGASMLPRLSAPILSERGTSLTEARAAAVRSQAAQAVRDSTGRMVRLLPDGRVVEFVP